jgi:putative oxidoreductase
MSSLTHYNTLNLSSATLHKSEGWATVRAYAFLIARMALMLVLLVAGLGKITTYTATATFMESIGVPAILLPAVIATEVLGGYSILLGWETRMVSLLMAAFVSATIVILHDPFGDPTPAGMSLKGLSLIGSLLVLAIAGAGQFSLDGRKHR